MALVFRTMDERYKGPCMLPSGAQLARASVFVDHLPPGFATDHYNPNLIKDRYSYRPRYVIDTDIIVHDEYVSLIGTSPKSTASTNQVAVELIYNTSIDRDGLDILLTHHRHEYQGALFPMPELTAEASARARRDYR
jgi:hypothetical protein